MVGSDGGVFVFGGGFHGSLPGLGIHVDDVTGIVPTTAETGYFLVGADGGVFAFDAPFENSLPGIGVHVDDIVGIVPTLDDQGYFLVGADGGVFAFDTPFENSLPGIGVHVDDIVGIATTPDDQGYLGPRVRRLSVHVRRRRLLRQRPRGRRGDHRHPGRRRVLGRRGERIGHGVRRRHGYGDLPGLGVPVDDIVAIVVSPDSGGYDLFGRDGGVFSFARARSRVAAGTGRGGLERGRSRSHLSPARVTPGGSARPTAAGGAPGVDGRPPVPDPAEPVRTRLSRRGP